MKKLKQDWQVATTREKVKFILVLFFGAIVGSYAIYLSLLFLLSSIENNADYMLLIPILLLCIVLFLISRIPTGPAKGTG